jgi:hypothetical protein
VPTLQESHDNRNNLEMLQCTKAWHPEEAAMGNSTLPTVLDKLCMVANINTRKLIEVLVYKDKTIKDIRLNTFKIIVV